MRLIISYWHQSNGAKTKFAPSSPDLVQPIISFIYFHSSQGTICNVRWVHSWCCSILESDTEQDWITWALNGKSCQEVGVCFSQRSLGWIYPPNTENTSDSAAYKQQLWGLCTQYAEERYLARRVEEKSFKQVSWPSRNPASFSLSDSVRCSKITAKRLTGWSHHQERRSWVLWTPLHSVRKLHVAQGFFHMVAAYFVGFINDVAFVSLCTHKPCWNREWSKRNPLGSMSLISNNPLNAHPPPLGE